MGGSGEVALYNCGRELHHSFISGSCFHAHRLIGIFAGRNAFHPILHYLADSALQLIIAMWLYKEPLHRHSVSVYHRLLISAGSEKQVGNAFEAEQLVGVHLVPKLEAVYLRHVDVRKNKEGNSVRLVQIVECIIAVLEKNNLVFVIKRLEYLRQDTLVVLIIFNNYYRAVLIHKWVLMGSKNIPDHALVLT
jgi:hypothetical protein